MRTLNPDPKSWVVLIVDDRIDNLEIARATLLFFGVNVDVASNGSDALAKIETVAPNLILLDLSMPQLSGWDLLKKIRENPKTTDIPVIALTAHAMLGDRERVMDAGFDGYISKPFDVTNLIMNIRAAISPDS
jgi:CheY-like chemotaxis protein